MTRESGSWEGKIEGVTHEGMGVGTVILKQAGKLLRRPIFVPFTVPGDIVVADITDQKRKYMFGDVSAILKESPERRVPKCRHFMTCGGCHLQHMSYKEQLKQKAKQVTFLLQRKGVQLPKEVRVRPAVERYNYRWRARIAVTFVGTGCVAGFRKLRSREIVQVEECHIIHPRIMHVIELMHETGTGLKDLEVEVTVVVGEKGKAGMLVILDDIPKQRRQDVKTFFEEVYARNRSAIGNVFFAEDGRTRSYGQVQEHFTYQSGEFTFSFLPQTFIQANVYTNPVLVDTCVRMLTQEYQPETVLDLFAGIGNLSLPIAKKVKHVLAVEGNQDSVLAGTTNAIRNDVKNVTFFQHSVEPYLRAYVKRYKRGAYSETYPKADAIVLDPPRTGLTPSMVKSLLDLGLPRIVYVSCNPTTLANDLRELQKKYTIVNIAAVDMFPDVSHVECVALLVKQ